MSDTITGTVIADRYRITGLLRSGRMGELYVARRADDGRRVSVKLLDPALFDNKEAVKRFERETRVTRSIDHPCSMAVLDYGHADKGPFLVMEYVEGESLSDIIDETGALSPERAARITARIAMALQAAHDVGVIHRDLAPTNVLIAQQGEHNDIVKVTDFGLSLLTEQGEDEATNLTAVGVRIGTPFYMAPEYIEEYELDHRADIYGLGVMLYEMLTGHPPFQGRPYKVMDQHVNTDPPPPSSKVGGIPQWLDSLVLHMMEKSPETRPQTAREVVSAIENGLGTAVDAGRYVAETGKPAPPRQQAAPKPTAVGPDPIITHMLEQHVLGVERGSARAPDRRRCYVVARVAATSPAAEIGVQPGWLVHLPEEDDKQGLLDTSLTSVVDERLWHFYAPSGERIAARTTGVPIGVELMRTSDNVSREYDPLVPDASALYDLWRQGSWELLEKLSWRTMTQQQGASGVLNTGLFAKFLGSDKPKLFDHPASLYHGAALIELGRATEGMPRIAEYRTKYAAHWRGRHHAIATFYAGRAEAAAGKRQEAADLCLQAQMMWPMPRIQAELDELAGEPVPTTQWVGQQFSDYSMDAVDGSASARLSEVCAAIDSSQLVAVCMMGGFRGNLDYDDFMHRWSVYTAHLPTFLAGLHVVTTVTEREHDHPEHYVGEDLARQAGVPFLVLHDYRAFVQRAVKPGAIPSVYLVDKYGNCVHEGPLGSVELWNALARAGELRMRRRQEES